MAFRLQVSNSLERLAARLCDDFRLSHQDAFQPVCIVTQTEGMNNWLKLQMAEKIGIAANYQFLKPNDLINRIYYLLADSFQDVLSASNLTWLIFKLLGEKEFIKKYPEISAYYVTDEPDKDMKRMGLAEKVADLFDQYQVYRADMIEKWNNPAKNDSQPDWQQYLWVNAKRLTGNSFPDKTVIGTAIEKSLNKAPQRERLKQKLPTVYLFGISLITEYHLRIFHQLAQYIDINFLILNPSPQVYWFDDKSEKQLAYLKRKGFIDNIDTGGSNPLLTAWGKIIQDTFNLLFQNEEIINTCEEMGVIEPLQDTLLHKVQNSVFNNVQVGGTGLFSQPDIYDGSIVINSCFSPAREVEILYNYLVHLIDKKQESLSSRDIVVMVGDIDLYASYIKAVFNNAPHKFNYTIADESYSGYDSISNSLHEILSITEQAFTAENVVRLLDSVFIRKRFGITDVTLIRNAVDAANIRFGFIGETRDDSIYLSWRYGLKRIMYGICISGSEEFGAGSESFYPLDMLEGNAAHEIIRFVHFIELLIASLEERKKQRTIAGWVEYLDNILHNFVCDKEDTTEEDYILLLKQLEDYNTVNELFQDEVTYEVFMQTFVPTLISASRRNLFAGGGITFCSLIPMRSIPFKVVALLGLNFDKFPRKENILSFNLMEIEKRKGDRNVKANDKHLFLETILSAGSYLYMSYIGQSVKDNSLLPPSSLIDELVDYIVAGAVDPANVRNQLITFHPLHFFSLKYKVGDTRYYSYLQVSSSDNILLNESKTVEQISIKEVALHELINFLKNPCKGFYNKVLGIYYNEEDIALKDTELFELDRLQQWHLKNQLLDIADDGSKAHLQNRLVKTGELPLKNMGKVLLETVDTEVGPLRTLYRDLIGNDEEQTVAIDLMIGDTRLKGTLENVYGKKLVLISWSKRETKYMLDAYIRYLAARATGYDLELYFISHIKEQIFHGVVLSRVEAESRLADLLALYTSGHEKILLYDTAFDIEPANIEKLDDKAFASLVKNHFENIKVPCHDRYMFNQYKKGSFQLPGTVSDFISRAQYLLVPLSTIFPGYYDKPST